MAAPSYFFVGIGGSGMLPLAAILRGRGAAVSGSDRSRDQNRTPAKFAYLEALGITLFPQDGTGVTDPSQTVVASAAIEPSVPDIAAADRLGAPRLTRAQLLAELFNAAPVRIAVGGTSGKSTTTGMIGWILSACRRDPTIMNGAVMKNFARTDAGPDAAFSSAVVGKGDTFVSEVDESDGSIALYRPTIALVTNVTLDHKPMDELRPLFADFAGRADIAIFNADDPESAALTGTSTLTYGFADTADVRGTDIAEAPTSISFTVTTTSRPSSAPAKAGAQAGTTSWAPAYAGEQDPQTARITLPVPGRHNASNALAALAAALTAGVPLAQAAAALAAFTGLKRRFEIVGTAGGITVIDDFAHNPDKIAATLATLHAFPGRLLLFFQPHGYGPLAVLKDALVETFAAAMRPADILILCDPAYFGGTVDRRIGSADVVAALAAGGAQALHIPARPDCGAKLAELARPGDRIVIMGARDDSLSDFAAEVLAALRH